MHFMNKASVPERDLIFSVGEGEWDVFVAVWRLDLGIDFHRWYVPRFYIRNLGNKYQLRVGPLDFTWSRW